MKSSHLTPFGPALPGRTEIPIRPDHEAPGPAPEDRVLAVDPAPMPAGIQVETRAMPELTLDGSLSEWGVPAGASGLYLAASADKVALAVAWATPPDEGVAVALASIVPSYPAIGWVQRGGFTHALTEEGCVFEQVPQTEGGWTNGNRNPPEVMRACLDILARHRAMETAFNELFVRRMVLSKDGIRAHRQESPPPWFAKVKHVAGPTGVEFELPLEALPELAQAPLSFLMASVHAGALPADLVLPVLSSPPEDETFPGWTRVGFEKPIAYGRYHALLAAIFRDPDEMTWNTGTGTSSYHPTDPEFVRHVGVVSVPVETKVKAPPGAMGPPTAMDRPMISERREVVFKPFEKFGNVSIGEAYVGSATYIGAEMIASGVCASSDSAQRKVGKDLHYLSYWAGGQTPIGELSGSWSVCAIRPDGTMVTDLLEPAEDTNSWASDDRSKPFNTPDFKQFGVRGSRVDRENGDKKTRVTITWTWSEKEGRYAARTVPPLPSRAAND